ncbi:MAG: ParB/RepB/Spo0J family partition protein [Gemmatimonadaceae bacterium]
MTTERPRRLGRGLEALIGVAQSSSPTLSTQSAEKNELQRISLSLIRPNPFQPRRDFADAELAELRASLQTSGMLQPIIVRRNGEQFELISGERRFRAATQLGWDEIPALVRVADARTMLTLALIENLQRADLNAIEEAQGFQRLHTEFALTHQQIADAVGKDRSTVTNLLRFLSLPRETQDLLERAAITMGHAKALLALPDGTAINRLAEEIVARQLSVRETERRVRDLTAPVTSSAPTLDGSSKPQQSHYRDPTNTVLVRQIEDSLRRCLQTDVRVQANTDNKGTIQISFYSNDDLDRILEVILGKRRTGD